MAKTSLSDQPWFSGIKRPSRYLGNEINMVRKAADSVDVSVALAFPDVYEVGMSHVGLRLLYHLLNSEAWIAAERVFCPWVDLEKELRQRSLPLTSLESERPLDDFDIVGFSLQHELSYTNVLTMLELGGIPWTAAERTPEDPLVIAGGPGCFNPEPAADFFDLFVIGDGEGTLLEICSAVRATKQKQFDWKKNLLSQLYRIPGVYIPCYFRANYKPQGLLESIEPLRSDYRSVRKAIVADIDTYAFPEEQVIPFTELVHDRLTLEISRGCTRGCRFCQAGMIYRPVRERSPYSILQKAQKALRLTGYEDLSLLSLSSGDYSCIEPLLKQLMDAQSEQKIALSLPSLRVDSLSPVLFEQIKRVRKTGFTLAPEAGNERLRAVLNKDLKQAEIIQLARSIYAAGWNLIKLYFMIGLPFEEEQDIEDLIRLVRQVAGVAGKGGRRHKLNISVAAFVPKSHTPFMWMSQISLEESRRRIEKIRNALKGSRVRVKHNQPELSWLEGIFARGDRRLSKVIMQAWKYGARLDAWGEHFDMRIWQNAFDETGVDPEFYLYRQRSLGEILPWDHISSGVEKDYLRMELQKARNGHFTPDCRRRCQNCGVCDHDTVDPILFDRSAAAAETEQPEAVAKNISIPDGKYRLTYSKTDKARYLSHLELMRVFTRAFRRSGINLAYSQGYHPMPKISFLSALPVGTESLQETLDLTSNDTADPAILRESVNRELPEGMRVLAVKELPSGKRRDKVKETHYLLSLNCGNLRKELLDDFLQTDYFQIVKKTGKGPRAVNARDLVKNMRLKDRATIELIMRTAPGPALKPAEIIAEVFKLSEARLLGLRVLKTKQLLG